MLEIHHIKVTIVFALKSGTVIIQCNMATFEIIEGKPGQGKSLYTARIAKQLLKRNKKYYERTGKIRHIVSNIKFSDSFEKEAGHFLKYWSTTFEIINLYNVDLLWDEIATELDSRNFANLTEELKRFLSQYRKRGVDIYANTQDYSMIDVRARLMVTRVASLSKIIGSRDPSPTKPPVKRIWGFVLIRELESILADDPHNRKYSILPGGFFINKEDVEMYDTTQDVPASPPLPIIKKYREIKYIGGPKDQRSDFIYGSTK